MKKTYATYLLFLFIAFLSLPTLVTALDKNADISIVYSLAEEEQSEISVGSFLDFVVNSHNFEALSEFKIHHVLSFDISQFAIKSHHIRIFSPPPDALG